MKSISLLELAFLFSCSAVAAAPQAPADFRSISEFHHTAWTGEQGAPQDMYALAQTPDGWLWLGGPLGLFRFDGVHFEPVTIEGRRPDQSVGVYSLFAEESGDLWVGYLYGGISRLGDTSVQHYGAAEGMSDAGVTAIGRDAQGVLWAGTSRGLMRLDGKRWRAVGTESGFTDASVTSMLYDDRGTLWIGGIDNVYCVRGREQQLERVFKTYGSVDFLKSMDDRLWYSDERGVHLLPNQAAGAVRSAYANARFSRVTLFDREGQLWQTGDNQGIERSAVPSGATEILPKDSYVTSLSSQQGLSSNKAHALLEDVEGNIWVVTAAGLDRFRHTNVRRIAPPGEESASIPTASLAAGDDGAVWIGSNHGSFGAGFANDGLWRFDGAFTRVVPQVIKEVTATERDASGTLWVGSSQGVWQREPDGQFRNLPDFPAEARGKQVRAITIDSAGEPWVSVTASSLYRLHHGTWEVNGKLGELPGRRPLVQARDPRGRVWFGYIDGRIAVVQGDRVSWYGEQDGLQLGMIKAIHVDRFTVVAGERAVAVLDDGRFHALLAGQEPAALEGVGGIVQARDGDLWINGARGAARIAAQDLQEALRTKSYAVSPEVFDAQDGFPGMSLRVWPLPTLIRGTDDRLWFSGTLGVGWLDPGHIHRNAIAPPVLIRSVLSGGKAFRNTAAVQLPQGTQDLQIAYTALSLSRPERVRFRYRLDGYDQRWIDPGTRRNAFYTNLPPGDYRFRVMAANESGVWNEAGASTSISIPPAFTQTRAFVVLCALAALLLLWGAYGVRIRQVTARERGRLQERLSERERIARDLHDTLLQGVQGLILRFQAIANRPDLEERSRQDLNDALDRADALLVEGRERVKDLRSATAAALGLKQQLLEVIEHLSAQQRAKLRVIENGTPRDMHPIVCEEAVLITSEAMLNALRHAAATTIEIEISYERRRVRINVRDDGQGMQESMIRFGREGHFGLMGMQERAVRIRGQLTVWSRLAAGTEISLTVPASMAYVRRGWTLRKQMVGLARSVR